VTWKNWLEAMGLDENGTDPDDPEEMEHWRAEFDGTAHKVHFDSDIGWHCNGCHDHVVDAKQALTQVHGFQQPQAGDWLPADEVSGLPEGPLRARCRAQGCA
jgi:hypothetical protein